MWQKILYPFSWLGLLFVGVLVHDSLEFRRSCQKFHDEAGLGVQQINESLADNYIFVVLTGDKDRLPAAFNLLQVFPEAQLLITGLSKKTSLSEIAELSPAKYRDDSALWKRIVVESEATSTVENAIETQKYLKARGLSQVILITSDYHLPRSLAIFDKWVDAEVIPFAVASNWSARGLVEYGKWVAYRFNLF